MLSCATQEGKGKQWGSSTFTVILSVFLECTFLPLEIADNESALCQLCGEMNGNFSVQNDFITYC